MPQIIPIKELKNTASISEMCRVSQEPIYITKNGYGDMVIMSQEVYDDKFGKRELAAMLNEVSLSIANGEEMIEASAFFDEMMKKYGK
ncbi:MAG: type II toxin-antitoxin system Phd/YefM family antitoxin [Bacillota bacterium]